MQPDKVLSSTEAFDAAVVKAMRQLSRYPEVVFVGQSVRWDGARIFTTLEGVPMNRREEYPVIEDHQLGYCIGLAMCGRIPVCIYPRIDFMLLATNQLINHLDKLPALWGIQPKVIIRTTVGRRKPLNAGPQHTNDHTSAFRQMLTTVTVIQVRTGDDVTTAYEKAIRTPGSFLIVENPLG